MANYLVTGGLGALGRAVAGELNEQGHRVAILDVATATDGDAGLLVLGGVDLADEAMVETAITQAVEQLGSIDGLANVAGGFKWQTVENGDTEGWDAMYRMNLRTAIVASRVALRHLVSGGAIVNVGAAAALNPGVGMGPYAASKAGVAALTSSLADELRERKIRVNAVLPTILDTPGNRKDMPDVDRSNWVSPAAAAKVVAFLLSASAAPITGASIPLSLG